MHKHVLYAKISPCLVAFIDQMVKEAVQIALATSAGMLKHEQRHSSD